MTNLETKILTLSEATGCTVVVGTRGASKSWFANCDGHEVEAGSLSTAVDSLVEQVLRDRQRQIGDLADRQRRAQHQVARLNGGKS